MILFYVIKLLLFLLICIFEKLYKEKQHTSQLKQTDLLLKNPPNIPIVPLLSFRLNDNGIIWSFGIGCENESIEQGRSYVDRNINISDCYFSRFSTNPEDVSEIDVNGGVIYVNGGFYSMNIHYSMFYSCIANNGGAIYFDSSISFLRMICANGCSASYCHFANIYASQAIQVDYLSCSYCSHTISGEYSIFIQLGDQRTDNTNSSMNNAYVNSGIGIFSPSSFASSHCTFSNNNVSDSICISIYSDYVTISISYANIVYNNSPYGYGVVSIEGEESKKMIYCIFQNNQNYLFCVFGGLFEVSHSFIDHSSSSFSNYLDVSTETNNSLTYRITYQMQFFNSHHCNADIPLQQRSLEETLRMTYGRTIDETMREAVARTYDSECEMRMLSSDVVIRKSEVYILPIFISFLIV